jgi:3-oxoacyl-[acyl-carrier-protein] synthase-3
MSNKTYAVIAGTGRYVPARRVTNEEMDRIVGEPVDAWLREKVGIEARHFMADDEVTSDLAAKAAKAALARAGKSPADVDLVIVASDTPDYLSPGTASVVQAKLGAARAGTFDVNCACASWVTALDVGAKAIAADEDMRTVVVVGAYGMSRYLDWRDKKTCTLFADGAGAVVLAASDRPGVVASKLAAHGEYHDALGIYTGGTARPATLEEVTANGRPKVAFVRKFPATFNTERWPALVDAVLEKAKLGRGDIDLYLFTQLNLRTIEGIMQTIGQPMERTHWIMDKWGYTGSACMPMVLDDAVEKGRLSPGQRVLFCASGGGIAMAASVVEWTMGAAP